MSEREHEPGEFTRLKMKMQLGDGPDRRGEITVETVRERDEDSPLTEMGMENVPIGIRDGEVDLVDVEGVPVDHATFAEFMLETQRARALLRKRLGLDDEDDEVDA